MAIVNGIGGAFIFIGKIFISALTVFICYFLLAEVDPYKSELKSVFLPLIVL